MSRNLFQFPVSTKKAQEFIDITDLIEKAVNQSAIRNGIVVVYCPHTTAGITINENADPDVVSDMIAALDKVFPIKGDYRHAEGNSHAHLKSSYAGAEKTIIVEEGKLLLGTWQSVYFCEFDGPRSRRVYIKVIPDVT